MQPLSPDEVKWAQSLGLLEKEDNEGYKVIGCITGLLFIVVVVGIFIFVAGLVQP